MQLDRITLGKMAKEMGFVRDTLEKVSRLSDVLNFMSEDELLSMSIALKGGTAINLTIFDLPRLSVDIDLDYCKSLDREEMLSDRKRITDRINKYMTANGYVLSLKTKNYHALDSFVYEYINAGGARDNLKIEINYMLRVHVLPVVQRDVNLPWSADKLTVLTLAPLEIFASKIVALLARTTPRDLFDIHNMIKSGVFNAADEEMLRKCVIFYGAIGAERPPEEFVLDIGGRISSMQIKRELIPVLRNGCEFNLKAVQAEVQEYLATVLVPTQDELEFWREFAKGEYLPELLFDNNAIGALKKHPMALWKCGQKSSIVL